MQIWRCECKYIGLDVAFKQDKRALFTLQVHSTLGQGQILLAQVVLTVAAADNGLEIDNQVSAVIMPCLTSGCQRQELEHSVESRVVWYGGALWQRLMHYSFLWFGTKNLPQHSNPKALVSSCPINWQNHKRSPVTSEKLFIDSWLFWNIKISYFNIRRQIRSRWSRSDPQIYEQVFLRARFFFRQSLFVFRQERER